MVTGFQTRGLRGAEAEGKASEFFRTLPHFSRLGRIALMEQQPSGVKTEGPFEAFT